MKPNPSVLISNARLLDPASKLDATGFLGLRDGRIVHAGKSKPREAFDEHVDARGFWAMPGIVDLAARFREPGQSYKASFAGETAAAYAGGITSVILPPDTHPVADTPAVVSRIHGIAARSGGIDARVLGALTRGLAGDALAEMSALQQAGCVGFSNAYAPMANSLIARRALEYAHGLAATVHVFAQDAALANGGCVHEGPVGTRLGLMPIPVAAEVAAIRHWVSLVEDTGARIHFCRLSTARGAGLVESAQRRGLPVTADVCAHQLLLTDADVDGFNVMAHVMPPLRAAADRDALRDAVRRGVIGAVCSDHQPHEADAKINPFPLTEPGASGLATLLPIVLELVHTGELKPLDAVARLCSGPARIATLDAGTLGVGASADVALVDPDAGWTVRAAELPGAGRNTPFDGRRFKGRVVRTFRAGAAVFAR